MSAQDVKKLVLSSGEKKSKIHQVDRKLRRFFRQKIGYFRSFLAFFGPPPFFAFLYIFSLFLIFFQKSKKSEKKRKKAKKSEKK